LRDRTSSVKGGPPPPGAELGGETNVLFDVWLVARRTYGALDQALEPAGLTADEFAIYSVLRSPATITPSELARWMGAPPTTVSSYVKRLEARGHLTRESNPDDRRSYVLQLTAEGRQAHQAAGKRFLPVLERVVEALGTKEEAGVRRSLAALHQALDAAT
jgi:DNA-binding MarR family transcriptional regulator